MLPNNFSIDKKWHQRIESLPSFLRIMAMGRPDQGPICRRHINSYQSLRRSVYFDIWKGPACYDSIGCRVCGFICYSPRPTADEIKAKYNFLERHYSDSEGTASENIRKNLQRSERVFATLNQYLSGNLVLDFGGGNGIVLSAFKKNGFQCYLADYSDHQLPGIEKIASSLDDLRGTYDCIMLNHVLEHVTEPGALISKLKKHLNDDGLLYVEVPIEIWGGIRRLEKDPVTHVNFFTDGSLKTILRMNGYRILSSFRGWSSYGNLFPHTTWAVAMKGYEKPSFEPQITEDLLFPNRIFSIKKLWHSIRKKPSQDK